MLAARARQRAVLHVGARVVTILAPPEVDPAGGEALWRNLHDLLRSRWRRALSGQPHLAFEYAWSPDGLAVRMWVPGPVPPGMVERAVESAWPAARTSSCNVEWARSTSVGRCSSGACQARRQNTRTKSRRNK